MTEVFTTKGLLPLTQLEVKDVTQWADNARIVATEYYHHGELVRRSVWADVLRPEVIHGRE